MIYIFDTSPLSTLFRNYYRPQFPSLWAKFEALVDNGQILSVREVLKEIEESSLEDLRNWAADHQEIFTTPTAQEGTVVTMEGIRPHAVKIPNICQYFEVPCMSLQEFMVQEKWVF